MVLDAVRARPELAREEQACHCLVTYVKILSSSLTTFLGGAVEQRLGGHHCAVPGLGRTVPALGV